jgi:fucose 4-O-acetylase-like acetyltransferase
LAARRTDIDSAKGLAILLVVFGHIVARTDPAGVHWYEPLRRAVYSFHMPFFLYLSGLVAALSGALLTPPRALPRLAVVRARRLLVPFFGLGALIVLGKCFAAGVIFVDNAPAGVAAGFTALVWHTAASPAGSIWYLAVLFAISLAAPAILRGAPARLPVLLGLALLLYAIPLPAYVYLDRFGTYAVFFVAGGAAGLLGPRWLRFVDLSWPVWLLLLMAALIAVAGFGGAWPQKLTMLFAGLVAMPALHGLVRFLPAKSSRPLLWLGRYCFTIYLFNTMCIGLAKGLLLHLAGWNAADFPALAAALMAAGTFGPVAIKRWLLRRIGPLDRLTD